jgi:hypothetical protein
VRPCDLPAWNTFLSEGRYRAAVLRLPHPTNDSDNCLILICGPAMHERDNGLLIPANPEAGVRVAQNPPGSTTIVGRSGSVARDTISAGESLNRTA